MSIKTFRPPYTAPDCLARVIRNLMPLKKIKIAFEPMNLSCIVSGITNPKETYQ